jgi:hypothetical protein
LIIHSEFKRLIEIYEDKRSKVENHSKSQKNQFSSKNWKDDRHFYESVTINKMSERKSHLSREIFKMLILKFNDRTIDTFEKKIDMFKNVFISASLLIDLIDISKFFYFNSIECLSNITKTKILTIIKRFVFDKISSFDDFINKLL